MTRRLFGLLKNGELPGVTPPFQERAFVEAFGEPHDRMDLNGVIALLIGRAQIFLDPDGPIRLVIDFYHPIMGCRALSMSPLGRRTGIYELLDMLDESNIARKVNDALSFEGQMVIRTEGGADILFNLEMRHLLKIVCEIAPHGWQQLGAS